MTNETKFCEASEKGKIIANGCLSRGYKMNINKLQNLLIMTHGIMLCKYNRPLFGENVVLSNEGLKVEGVEENLGQEFKERFPENLMLFDREITLINEVVSNYGNLDVISLLTKDELIELKDILSRNESEKLIIPNGLLKEILKNNALQKQIRK